MTVEISVYILRTTQLAFMLYINTNTISISKRQGSTQNYHDMTTYSIYGKKMIIACLSHTIYCNRWTLYSFRHADYIEKSINAASHLKSVLSVYASYSNPRCTTSQQAKGKTDVVPH